MRFTFLLPCDNLTGGNRVVAIYARELIERGHEVLVVSCAPDRPGLRGQLRALLQGDWQRLRQGGAPAGHVQQSGVPHKVLEHPRAIRADDLPDADVIIATWWETAVWMDAMPAAKGRKVHLIQGYEVWLGDAMVPRVHAALRLPNLKIAISGDLRRTIEEQLGDLGITVIPNAVDPTQFDAPERQRRDPPRVGFVYSAAAIKGADICARACELARQQLGPLQVVAFGAELPTREVPLPGDTRFFHRPAQGQLREIYASCDAWLFGSRLDSFGLPILEAMACRTPVIAVPVGAAPDLLADGCGLLVARESPAAMAAAIVALLQSPERWQALSQRAYRKAHGYSWDDAVSRLLEVLAQR